MRNVSGLRLVMVSGLVLGFTQGGKAVASPLPGMTARTNSQECIDKFRELYTLSGTIMTTLPSASSVQRLDILTGGIPVKNGFEALGRGR